MSYARLAVAILTALSVSGCLATPGLPGLPALSLPSAPPLQSPIDAVVYGAPVVPVAQAVPVVPAGPPVIEVPSILPIAPGVAVPTDHEEPYTLDAGDRLRVVVYGQDGLTNTYAVDAAGRINMPLIGAVPARGLTTAELSQRIKARLREGYLREPHVAVEVDAYRPFFILGEVTFPGQYPYVAHMTAETAVAIAGGFTPRAYRCCVEVTRQTPQGPVRLTGPMATALRPGDTIVISERWF